MPPSIDYLVFLVLYNHGHTVPLEYFSAGGATRPQIVPVSLSVCHISTSRSNSAYVTEILLFAGK